MREGVHVTSGYSRRLHARGSRTPEERSTWPPGNAEAQVFQKSLGGEAGGQPTHKQLTAFGPLALVRAGPPKYHKDKAAQRLHKQCRSGGGFPSSYTCCLPSASTYVRLFTHQVTSRDPYPPTRIAMAAGPAVTLLDTLSSRLRSLDLPRMILKTPTHDGAEQSLHLSALDQNIVRVYTQVFLVFPFPDAGQRCAAIRALEHGLRASLHSFPFLAGKLSLAEDRSGKLTLTYPTQVPDLKASGIFACKVNETFRTYDDLRAAGMPPDAFPGSRLRPDDFANYPGIPPDGEGVVDFSDGKQAPVMRVQANFISGGLILSTYVHHTVMDCAGINVFWKCFAENVANAHSGTALSSPSKEFLTAWSRKVIANGHSNRLRSGPTRNAARGRRASACVR